MTVSPILLVSLLIVAAILLTKVGSRLGVPSLLLFLLLGMVAGADGLGLTFDSYKTAEFIGRISLSVIMFTAGLETPWSQTRPIFKPSIVLSILGVFLTMCLTGVFIYFVWGGRLCGLAASLVGCLMIGAILSSTDSASVFSILEGKRLHLREDLGPLLEVESGSNDPIANILTIIMVSILTATGKGSGWLMAADGALTFVLQVGVGLLTGLAIGYAGKWLLKVIHLDNVSLYAILILSICLIANSLADTLQGNGLLAAYCAAIFIGNKSKLEHRHDVLKFFEALTWMMQLTFNSLHFLPNVWRSLHRNSKKKTNRML